MLHATTEVAYFGRNILYVRRLLIPESSECRALRSAYVLYLGHGLGHHTGTLKFMFIKIGFVSDTFSLPVAPVAYQVILEPGIVQFREFEPRRVHIRINSLGLFLVHKLTCGKRESVS